MKSENSSIPVTVRVSKTRVLKLPIFIQFQIFSRALCLFWLVWPHCMAVILTYPNVVCDDINFTEPYLMKNGFCERQSLSLPWTQRFFLIFVLFTKQRIHIQVATRVHRFSALSLQPSVSCRAKKSRKSPGPA